MLNRVESTEYSRATTVVYTHAYPIPLPLVGIDKLARLNARCFSIVYTVVSSQYFNTIRESQTTRRTVLFVMARHSYKYYA